MPITDLQTTLTEILTAAGASLDARALAGEFPAGCIVPPADRRYVTHNEPAWDCNQLVVYWSPVATISPLRGRDTGTPCAVLPAMLVHVQLALCGSPVVNPEGGTGDPPTAQQWLDFTDCLNRMAWALLTDLVTLGAQGNLWSDQTSCDDWVFDQMLPLGPQGGMAGVDLQFWIDRPITP